MNINIPETVINNEVIPSFEGISGHDFDLRKGIWPRSAPLLMAAFYMFLFIIRPWEELMPRFGDIHFERIYVISLLIVIFVSPKKNQFKMTSQSMSVLLFLGALGISGIFAVKPDLAWEVFYTYLTLVIFYFVLIIVIRSPYDLVFIITCYIATMTVYLAKAQWEFFFNARHHYRMEVIRLIGIEDTFGGPNAVAESIVISLPMLFFLWSSRKEFSHQWPAFYKKWFPRFLLSYFVVAVTSIILTNSRTGMLGFVLFLFLVSVLRGQRIGKKIGFLFLSIFLISVLWTAMPSEQKNRMRTIWDPTAGPKTAQISAHGRIEGLLAGVEMFERFPLSGVGIGNFKLYRWRHLDGIWLQPHNLLGELLGETGLIGFGAFFLMVMSTFTNIRKVRTLAHKHSDQTIDLLSRLCLACKELIILLFFFGLTGHNLTRFNWLWLAAFVLLALTFVDQKPTVNRQNNILS
jgi:hypothetical protein